MDMKGVDTPSLRANAAGPILAGAIEGLPPAALVHFAQDIIGSLVPCTEIGADQNAFAEFEPLQMILNSGKVLVIELALEHREQRREGFGLKGASVLVGDAPQPFQELDRQLQQINCIVEDRPRRAADEIPKTASPSFHELCREIVDAPDDRFVLQAVLQYGLPVEDRFRVAQAGEHDSC